MDFFKEIPFLLLRLDEPLKLSSIYRRCSSVISFRYVISALAWVFAFIAILAFSSNLFMEAQLVFAELGLLGVPLLIMCGVVALMIGINFAFQEGRSLHMGVRDVTNWLRSCFSSYTTLDIEKNTDSEQSETPQPELKSLSKIQKMWAGFSLSLGSFVAVGSSLFWSITAFCGVCTIAIVLGGSAAAPYVLVFAVLAAIAQGSASLFQEGRNLIEVIFEWLEQRWNFKLKESLLGGFSRTLDKIETKLEAWLGLNTSHENSITPTVVILPVKLKSTPFLFFRGKASPRSPEASDPPSLSSSPMVLDNTRVQKPKKRLRAYLPSFQGFVRFSVFLAVLAAAANFGDIFMEAQLVFATAGLSIAPWLGIVCGVVALVVTLAYIAQESRSLVNGYNSIFAWFSTRGKVKLVVTEENTTEVEIPSAKTKAAKSVGFAFALLTAGYYAMAAFFGVVAVCLAFSTVVSIPASLIVALALLAAFAQGFASLGQEGRNLWNVLGAWAAKPGAKLSEAITPQLSISQSPITSIISSQPVSPHSETDIGFFKKAEKAASEKDNLSLTPEVALS